jgi:Leucine-rich repeat (LRR) protein
MTSLRTVNMAENVISGPVPAGLGALPNLVELGLRGNGLTGTIPDFSANQGSLQVVDLEKNQLSGSVTGLFTTTPPQSLEQVRLTENMLVGTLPATIGQFTGLVDFRLEFNMISGSLPTEVSLLVLSELNLKDNNLIGTIPTHLGTMTTLSKIRLENNQITGEIPSELGLLTDLNELRLENNNLVGQIPGELASLPLDNLFLSNNMLEGDVSEFCADGNSLKSFAVNSCSEVTITCSCCTHCCNYECTKLES